MPLNRFGGNKLTLNCPSYLPVKMSLMQIVFRPAKCSQDFRILHLTKQIEYQKLTIYLVGGFFVIARLLQGFGESL
jgi:hypothetical protein